MKKRWKLPNEYKYYTPYEAGDDRTHKQVIMELEHILTKYKVWPTDRHMVKVKKQRQEEKERKEAVVMKVEHEDGTELKPIEPVNEPLDAQ